MSQQTPGIFIAYTEAGDLQEFDPDTIFDSTSLHVFVRYDTTARRYTSLLQGSAEFKIRGSLSFTLGELEVTIDNANPYLSLVTKGQDKEARQPSILGFLDLRAIVNEEGQEAVALLEANRLNNFKDLIKPYDVTRNGILLKGKPVTASVIGIELEAKSPCLDRGAVILERTSLDKAKASSSSEESKAALREAIKRSQEKNPLNRFLKLRVEPDKIIALDFHLGEVKIVRELKGVDAQQKICVMDTKKLR